MNDPNLHVQTYALSFSTILSPLIPEQAHPKSYPRYRVVYLRFDLNSDLVKLDHVIHTK